MREVIVSDAVLAKVTELRFYLSEKLLLSEYAAEKRVARIAVFFDSMKNDVNYAECRFAKWRELRWRCVPFEKDWVFAYQAFEGGIIIMDMASAQSLVE